MGEVAGSVGRCPRPDHHLSSTVEAPPEPTPSPRKFTFPSIEPPHTSQAPTLTEDSGGQNGRQLRRVRPTGLTPSFDHIEYNISPSRFCTSMVGGTSLLITFVLVIFA